MAQTALRVENLGKRYRIGTIERYRTARDALAALGPRLRGKSSTQETSRSFIWALKDVSFEVFHGEVMGIIGPNGAGKSTLLKVLSRITTPTVGQGQVFGRVGSLLEVGTGFHPELTGRENIYLNGSILGMTKKEVEKRFDEIVAFAEVSEFIDTPVKRYSSGMYLRLAFGVAAHLDPEILVIDEVLAVGDMAFQEKCLRKMDDVASSGRTVLFVSHDLSAISHLCSRAILLKEGMVQKEGSAKEVVAAYTKEVLAARVAASGGATDIFVEGDGHATASPSISRIEILDDNDESIVAATTWEPLRLRVHVRSKAPFERISVALYVKSLQGQDLMLIATEPDGGFKMSVPVGTSIFECRVDRFPLSAGTYVLGGGLAIPNVEWLWRSDSMALLTVLPSDVLGSGVAPDQDRYLVPALYEWSVHKQTEKR